MGSRSRPRRDKGKGKEREGTAGRGGEVRIEMSGLPPIWSVIHLTICTLRPADKSSPTLHRPSLLPGSIQQMRSRRSWTKPRRRVSLGHHRLRRPFRLLTAGPSSCVPPSLARSRDTRQDARQARPSRVQRSIRRRARHRSVDDEHHKGSSAPVPWSLFDERSS